MSKTTINLLLDTLLLAAFIVLIYSSIIVRFVFPPGADSRGWFLWGLAFDQWETVQFAMVAVLALGVLIHVMLHWSWVCGVIATRLTRDKKAKIDDGAQTLYGVGLLIAIVNVLGFAIAVAALTIQAPR
jgi:hypothetical protein